MKNVLIIILLLSTTVHAQMPFWTTSGADTITSGADMYYLKLYDSLITTMNLYLEADKLLKEITPAYKKIPYKMSNNYFDYDDIYSSNFLDCKIEAPKKTPIEIKNDSIQNLYYNYFGNKYAYQLAIKQLSHIALYLSETFPNDTLTASQRTKYNSLLKKIKQTQ